MGESKSRKLEPQHQATATDVETTAEKWVRDRDERDRSVTAGVPTTGDQWVQDQDERDHPVAAGVPTTGDQWVRDQDERDLPAAAVTTGDTTRHKRAAYGFCAKCGQQKASDSHYVCPKCSGSSGYYFYCASCVSKWPGGESRDYVCKDCLV
jgi:hypothetical protein